MSFDWAAEGASEALRHLWCDRGVSATQIARRLAEAFGQPLTRSAVLGRIHRLGLQKAGEAPQAEPQPEAAPAGPQACPGATLMDLQSWHCKYILPTRVNNLPTYCGELTEHAKSSWCPHHSAIVWDQRPAVTRERYRDHLLEQRAQKRAARGPDARVGRIVSTFSRSPAIPDVEA